MAAKMMALFAITVIFATQLKKNFLQLPKHAQLPNSEKILPFVFVADNAFGLKRYMMKPYLNQHLPFDEGIFTGFQGLGES